MKTCSSETFSLKSRIDYCKLEVNRFIKSRQQPDQVCNLYTMVQNGLFSKHEALNRLLQIRGKPIYRIQTTTTSSGAWCTHDYYSGPLCTCNHHSGPLCARNLHSGPRCACNYQSGPLCTCFHRSGPMCTCKHHSGPLCPRNLVFGPMCARNLQSGPLWAHKLHSGPLCARNHHSGPLCARNHQRFDRENFFPFHFSIEKSDSVSDFFPTPRLKKSESGSYKDL